MTGTDSRSGAPSKRIIVKLGTQNRVYLLTDSGTMQSITAEYLRGVVPAFQPGNRTIFEVNYGRFALYHCYEGGPLWIPTAPQDRAAPGDVFELELERLTPERFVSTLGQIRFRKDLSLRWMSEIASVTIIASSKELGLNLRQKPSLEGISSARIPLSFSGLHFRSGKTWSKFRLVDIFGNSRLLAAFHQPSGIPRLGLWTGHYYSNIVLVSFDGLRLRIAYSRSRYLPRVATLYFDDPSLYIEVGSMRRGTEEWGRDTGMNIFEIEEIKFRRTLENLMIGGSMYDHGRLGAEVAFAVATKKFGIECLALFESSRGGADLKDVSRNTVGQARMLVYTHALSQCELRMEIEKNLFEMVKKLRQDFRYNRLATTGLAILSYMDGSRNIRCTVVRVPSRK